MEKENEEWRIINKVDQSYVKVSQYAFNFFVISYKQLSNIFENKFTMFPDFNTSIRTGALLDLDKLHNELFKINMNKDLIIKYEDIYEKLHWENIK